MMHIVDMTALVGLVTSAVRTLVLAGAAALALAAFRVKNTSLRLFTWTAVLYAALAMPLLGRLLPPISIPTPAFLQSANATFTATSKPPTASRNSALTTAVTTERHITVTRLPTEISRINRPTVATSNRASDVSPAAKTLVSWPSASQWNIVAGAIYLAVSLMLLSRFFIGIIFSRRLLRALREIREPRLIDKVAFRVRMSGTSATPRVVESSSVFVPVTVGALRSTILLPADWREWDETTLDAVIVHEMSHVERRDALTQRLSLLHRAIFWFSPLAWWLDRHLAVLAECASDEAALSCGTDRREYARTLLKFFEALQAAPGRIWWPGVSMAKAGQAEKRLERILGWRGTVAMSLKKSLAVVVIAVAIPVVYLTASARPSQSHDWQDVDSAQVPPTPPPPALAPMAPRAAIAAPPVNDAVLSVPATAPVAAVAPASRAFAVIAPRAPASPVAIAAIAPVAPVAAFSGQSGSYGHGSSYAFGFDDEQRFVIVTGKSDSLTMSGTGEDAHHVEKLRKKIPGDFIWFERDEKSYIIRDQATIDRARSFWAPQEELGRKQEALGKQQEELGRQQEELGSKMEQVRVNVPDMTAALDKLKAKLQKLGPSATMEQIGDLQSEIGELQSKIGEIQSQAGEQQGKLGEEQGALGEKQGKLGEQQGKLGEEQGELARKATIEMKQLLDESIKNGKAQPESDGGSSPTL
jgi:bla regulator protein BlaR1